MRLFRYKTEIIKLIINNSNEIAIYGAGTMGKAVCKCITESPYNVCVKCYVVKSMEGNNDYEGTIPIIDIAHAKEYKNFTLLIALNGKYIPEVVRDLTEAGFANLVPISFDGDEWTAIRGNWINNNNIIPEDVIYLFDDSDIYFKIRNNFSVSNRFHIYVAHSIYDRKLSEDIVNQPYEIDIQVGSALTDRIICKVRDNAGIDNISDKNRQYCELTGIYWAWKNDKSEYIGFSHYRRRFKLSEKQLNIILNEGIDVIVTEPIVNFATVKGQYEKDHIIQDWNIFMDVIAEVAPEYFDASREVQNSIYYFAYNMFIMKHEIFDEYCLFIFRILERCGKLIGSKEDVYQNRYIGFLAERLLSIFLTKNSELKVAIADKHFIE